jgi:FAD/FMN-containing dehydrogenase
MRPEVEMMSDDIPRVRGPVLRPGEDGFDAETSGYNLLVSHRPALVVGATGAADVMEAVRFAAARGMPVAVQATGHGSSTRSA